MKGYFANTIFLFFCVFSITYNFTYSYCPPLVAPEETNISCRPPNDFQFSNCSSSWLPNGTVAHYECVNDTTGEQISGYILCENPDEERFRKVKMQNSTDLPCGLRRDYSVPEIHIFGYSSARNFTTPNPNYYKINDSDVVSGDSDIEYELTSATDYERLALKLHNVFRIRHGSPPLKLKRELSDSAKKWADYLSSKNIFDMAKSNFFGQNLFNSKSKDKLQAASDASQNWYYEGMNVYNWNDTEKNWENSLALNFAQVIWKSTEYLGIGVSSWSGDANGSVVVAYYYPSGNVVIDDEDSPEKHFLENVKPLIT